MGRLDFVYKPIAKATANYLKAEATANLSKNVNNGMSAQNGPAIKRSAFDNTVQDRNTRTKPGSSVGFDTLRRFSVSHEVARICINARKRQISSLDWEIVAVSAEDHNDYSSDIDLLKKYFKSLGGYRVRFREFQDTFIEDLLVLDAAVLYKQRVRGGAVEYYMPVDAATIRLRVDEAGNTPQPPEAAYQQYVRGALVGEYTAEEMIYEMMNPRSDTPYGLAPLESLIMVVTSALKASLFNMDFLTAGNIPEGLLSLPENWNTSQIQEFMDYFDSLVAGNTQETAKMKPIPGGSTYIETKKRDDMAFKEFNDWLMKITCAMFDIQPQEIGFTDSVNRANGAEQNDITTRRGILPLANLLTEVFNDIIQEDLGFTHLRFHYVGLEDRDMLQDAQAKQARLNMGLVTIDEVRKEEGLMPLGIDRPYILGTPTFVTDEVVNPPKVDPAAEAAAASNATGNVADKPKEEAKAPAETKTVEPEMTKAETPEDRHIELVSELRRLDTYVAKRLKAGKSLRKFESNVLPEDVVTELNDRIAKAEDYKQAKTIIKEYRDDYQVGFIEDVIKLKSDLKTILE
jgi:HK97 family phage portal protein